MVDEKTKKALTIGGVVVVVILVLISLIAGLVWATKDRRTTEDPTDPVEGGDDPTKPSFSSCDSWQTIPKKGLNGTTGKSYSNNMGTSDLCETQCYTDRCDWFKYDPTHHICYTEFTPVDKTVTSWVKTPNADCPYVTLKDRNATGTIIQTYSNSNQPNCQSNCDSNSNCGLFTFDTSNTCKTYSLTSNNDITTYVRNI